VLVAEAADRHRARVRADVPTLSSLRAAGCSCSTTCTSMPAARRGGVARRLMEAAVHEARTAVAVALTLQTARTNLPAQRLYESLGWRRDDEFRSTG